MNIERTNQLHTIQASSSQPTAGMRTKYGEMSNTAKANNQDSGTHVKLSQLTQQIKADNSRDINTERLAEIKAKMDAGELRLDSDHIASALVHDIFRFS